MKTTLLIIPLLLCGFVTSTDSANLASQSSLKQEYPGFVDGVKDSSGSGCGGGGGPCWGVHNNSSHTITFPRAVAVSNVVFYVGCNDQETMDGRIEAKVAGKTVKLATFKDVGCGGAVSFPRTVTDNLVITMTGGGGPDNGISVQEIEMYGEARVPIDPGKPFKLVVELKDGSRVTGTPNLVSVPIRTSVAKLDVPLRVIDTAERGDDGEWQIHCSNGDELKGELGLDAITVTTTFDKVVIALGKIVRITTRAD